MKKYNITVVINHPRYERPHDLGLKGVPITKVYECAVRVNALINRYGVQVLSAVVQNAHTAKIDDDLNDRINHFLGLK